MRLRIANLLSLSSSRFLLEQPLAPSFSLLDDASTGEPCCLCAAYLLLFFDAFFLIRSYMRQNRHRLNVIPVHRSEQELDERTKKQEDAKLSQISLSL